ncbi:unnamed protein product [Rhizophagus irregularis]|nr:unnamed protein product [Rhizophagus irregularis]
MFYEVAPFTEPTNHDDNSEEYIVKSGLGNEFKDYVGGFPLINTLIEIENGTRFHSMEIAVHFIEQVFKCDLGGRYTKKLLRSTLGKEKSKGTKKQQGCMWQMNVNSRCDAGTIRNLLQPKYPDHVFLTQDLGNAIQKIKQEKGLNNLGDAASLLMRLLELQADE